MQVYAVETEQLQKLRSIADQLQGGSDKERDIGHRLWLVVKAIEDQPIMQIPQ